MAKTLREVALEAQAIYDSHDQAAGCDALFDGGEFSIPAHGRMADQEVRALALKWGFTPDQVVAEMNRIWEEALAASCFYCASPNHATGDHALGPEDC